MLIKYAKLFYSQAWIKYNTGHKLRRLQLCFYTDRLLRNQDISVTGCHSQPDSSHTSYLRLLIGLHLKPTQAFQHRQHFAKQSNKKIS